MGESGTQNSTATLLAPVWDCRILLAGKTPSFVTGRWHNDSAVSDSVDLLCWSTSHTLHGHYLREFPLWGPDLSLRDMVKIWTSLGAHGTVMLSELLLCTERSAMQRSQGWHRSSRQGVLISM